LFPKEVSTNETCCYSFGSRNARFWPEPVKAENPAEPGAPGSDKTLGDAKSAQTPPATTKNTGALNPDTPDPTKNTPGAEPKN